MPFKRKGAWYVDKRPVGYGHRIARSCGRGANRAHADAMEATLAELALHGIHEPLDALRAGHVTLAELHTAKVNGKLDDLLRSQNDPPLEDVLREFEAIHTGVTHRFALQKLREVIPANARQSWLADPKNLRKLVQRYAAHKGSTLQRQWQTVNALLRMCFGEAKRVEIMEDVPLRKTEGHRDIYLLPEEIKAVENVAGDWWLMIEFALTSGLRRGEQLDLRIRDLDLTNGAVRVRKGKTKAARRRVPLRGQVLADLRGWIASQDLKPNDPLFPGIDGDMVKRAWWAIREMAGITHVRWHDLRHTFGVFGAKAGVPLPTLKVWMGHKNIETTMIYATYIPDEQSERHINAIDDMGLGGNPNTDVPTPAPTPETADAASDCDESILDHFAFAHDR